MLNLGFVREESFATENDSQRNVIQSDSDMINASTHAIIPVTNWRSKFSKLWNTYQWRMRHYFYIHLSVFFINALVFGAIIWFIEDKQIPFIDCWFISATCVFTCGLQTYQFSIFKKSSQIILLIVIDIRYYDKYDSSDSNVTINPFYASLVISVSGFNQNGLSVWNNGIILFVNDIFMNIIIMLIVMSGTSLFPAILRGIVTLMKSLMPWKYKIYFDYILLNNHRLSTVIFPSIQTRLYVTITILMHILGITIALILDFNNPNLAMYKEGQRFLILMFQTINTRFGGYATINLSNLLQQR
ncbi:hypothetical protein I4U23_011584 [Adineta vaga]|nr:hypothetical protein I4U23_011584 [Adineta vaga]